MGFPGGSVVKNQPANAGDMGLILGLGRPPGEGNGNPVQYSVHGKSSDMTKSLNNNKTHQYVWISGLWTAELV